MLELIKKERKMNVNQILRQKKQQSLLGQTKIEVLTLKIDEDIKEYIGQLTEGYNWNSPTSLIRLTHLLEILENEINYEDSYRTFLETTYSQMSQTEYLNILRRLKCELSKSNMMLVKYK